MGDKLPFSRLPEDLSCIDKAIAQNDLTQLQGLFNNSEFNLLTSDEIHDYFLAFSNDDIHYDLAEITQVLADFKTTLLTDEGQLQLAIRMHLPVEVKSALPELLQLEMNRCFEYVFDTNGELRPWFIDIFSNNQLPELYQQFGEVKVKFQLLVMFAKEYSVVFKNYLSPSDKECSDMLVALFEAQLVAYQRLAQSLSILEKSLVELESGFKAKSTVTQLYQLAKQLFFCNRFGAQEMVISCIEQVNQVIKTPHDRQQINKLRLLALKMEAQTSDKYWMQFLGALSVFAGAFLLVAAVIGLPVSTSLFTSSALLASGIGFFGGGIHLFQKGLPIQFESVVSDLVEKSEMIEHQYQQSLAL